jgi:hypothetical protein
MRTPKPKSPAVATKRKRKVSFAGCRVKGSNFEKEVVEIFEENGIPSQRVLGSGALGFGAKSDIKIGVELDENGKHYASDESRGLFRIEAKNHASTPDWVFEAIGRNGPEAFWKHLEQDAISRAVLLRRAKIPAGAIKEKRLNEYIGVFLGAQSFIELVKLAYGLK